MRRILFDEPLEAELWRSGFVRVSLLDRREAEEFRSLVVPLNEESKRQTPVPQSPAASFWSTDAALKRRIFDELTAFLMPRVDRLVDRFVPLSINLVDKEPGGGEVPPHEHWTFVDESRYESITICVPLVDTTRENGTLELVRGSHKVSSKYRGVTIPPQFRDFIPALKAKYCEPVDLRVGEAVVFFDSTVHYSPGNHSPRSRLACNFNLYPHEARPLLYHWDSSTPKRLWLFGIDVDFLCRYPYTEDFGRLPRLGAIPYRLPEALDEAEFAARLARVLA